MFCFVKISDFIYKYIFCFFFESNKPKQRKINKLRKKMENRNELESATNLNKICFLARFFFLFLLLIFLLFVVDSYSLSLFALFSNVIILTYRSFFMLSLSLLLLLLLLVLLLVYYIKCFLSKFIDLKYSYRGFKKTFIYKQISSSFLCTSIVCLSIFFLFVLFLFSFST